MKRLTVLLAATLLFAALASPAIAAEVDKFDIASVSAELSTHQAGAHPDFTTNIEMAVDPASPTNEAGFKLPYAFTKDIKVILPSGLLANLNAIDTCSTVTFVTALTANTGCPFGSQVGIASISVYGFPRPKTVAIYNLETSGEDNVARLGFYFLTVPAFIEAHVRSDGDYGVTADVTGISSLQSLNAARTTLWGVPGDPSHDAQRLTVAESQKEGKSESPPRSSGRPPEPFMTNPTTCGVPLEIGFEADSYQEPGVFHKASTPLGEITECGKLSFEPSFSLTPTNREAAAPSGADATLNIVQNEAANGLATSQLRNTVVKLPEGVRIAAGAADGLEACSEAQVGYKVSPPPSAHCPEASKIASVEIDSPSLSRPIQGAVYQRTPEPGHLTRAWLVADELGVHVKLPGEFQLDPNTGRITSLFLETPQVPVRQFKLHFKGGARGVLATPNSCGTYQTEFNFSPWSGTADVAGKTPMTFDQHCNTGGFSPNLSAGTINPAAGDFSPFVTNLTSEAGEQNLAGLSISLPQGVLAKLAGVGVCSEAQAVTASCPASSQVGTTTVATGPGPSPLWIPQPGKEPTAVYLAGPYKGGPYSLVVKTPAQAGPFDLGTVVVRAAIHVDPETAQVTVNSDPLPQFLEGIPVSYRTVHVDVNRANFTLNPTSCDPMQVTGTASSAAGATAGLVSRFQAASCASLGFKPDLMLSLKGGTKRSDHPALRAVLNARPGDANIGQVTVALPHSEFLAQEHIRTICTRVQFAVDACPAGSIYGKARAFTPLLDQPLEGPVYLRSSSHPLPDLVIALHGQVDVDLVGRIDSFNGGIRSVFAAVPDAPVSKFVLSMQGGKKGLLVNSRNLCAKPSFAGVRVDGQNGKSADQRPRLANSCAKAGRRAKPARLSAAR
jgi:hypothetical protein